MRLGMLGAAAAACLSAAAASPAITNPGFEADGIILSLVTEDATGWTDNVDRPFGGDVLDDLFCTEGAHGARLYSRSRDAFEADENAYLRQMVDLTGITEILFDASLSAHAVSPDPPWHDFLQAAFYVDATQLWSSQTVGIFLNQSVDTSPFSGLHAIEFRLEALSAGDGNGISSWFEIDNVREVPEPSTVCLLAFGGLATMRRKRR